MENALPSLYRFNLGESSEGLRSEKPSGLCPEYGPLKNALPVNFFIHSVPNVQTQNGKLEGNELVVSSIESVFNVFHELNNRKGKKMECPLCKSVFPKFKEILMLVDRSFYCHCCWNRLISYPDGEAGCKIEVDPMGEKWKKIEKAA